MTRSVIFVGWEPGSVAGKGPLRARLRPTTWADGGIGIESIDIEPSRSSSLGFERWSSTVVGSKVARRLARRTDLRPNSAKPPEVAEPKSRLKW